MNVSPYLHFNGNCAEAFKVYEKVLGGKNLYMMTYGDSPMKDKTAPEQQKNIMHASLKVGETVLMGSDAPPQHFATPAGMSVTLDLATPEEAEQVFAALAEGGSVRMPIQETFWAKRFGMLTDRFGTPWMFNCAKPM